MAKKCPKCGSKHFVTARAYETLTEYNNGVIIKQRNQTQSLYPMFECVDCGFCENAWGNNNINLK